MGNRITTYTGRHVDPSRPDPEDIRIEDIAHALSLICRGNGHVRTFWSVGEHCICCAKEAKARGLSGRLALACLLHDASECYMSDIPRPFKQMLPEYRRMEDRMLDTVYRKFLGSALTPEEQKELKAIDDAMLWYDLTELLGERPAGPAPVTAVRPDYAPRPFAGAEEEYLCLFRELSASCAPASDESGTDRIKRREPSGVCGNGHTDRG